MTDRDKKDIAQYIAEELKDHQPAIQCPNGIDHETAQGMKELVGIMKTGKKAATWVIVTAFVSGVITLVIAGFWSKVSSLFGK
ncbi:MAG: hypothetical protein WCS27_09495 [Victivallaceae bacterium]|jgi:hypothetical protein